MTSDDVRAAQPIASLTALEARLARDLLWLKLPPKSWVKRREDPDRQVFDVVVIGGGMCGLAAMVALKLKGVDNILCLDRSAEGFEGPWATFSRMRTLRSPKDLTGPAFGLPALTYRAWHEAKFGERSFEELGKIDRLIWMDYLRWYRKVMQIPMRNGADVTRIVDVDDLLRIEISNGEALTTRRAVLATGRNPGEGASVPFFLTGVSRRFWAHSAEDIDWGALGGKRIIVIGAGASAMDNAGHALEHGAGKVDLLVRRKDLPRVNKFTGIESPGTTIGFVGLPDAEKWRFIQHASAEQVPPPRESVLRVVRSPDAHFHLGFAVDRIEERTNSIVAYSSDRAIEADFVIAATGFVSEAPVASALGDLSQNILRWEHVIAAPVGQENASLARSPFLGQGFEFRERQTGLTPALALIHCFNYAATLSHGKVSGDIPGVSEGAERLARWIAQEFFREEHAAHFQDLVDFSTPELLGDELEGSLG